MLDSYGNINGLGHNRDPTGASYIPARNEFCDEVPKWGV